MSISNESPPGPSPRTLMVVLASANSAAADWDSRWQRSLSQARSSRFAFHMSCVPSAGARWERRGAMVAVPSVALSARTVALVLAGLGYRGRLRRRDRWSRAALLAHQDRALRRLREYAYQKSRFYQDFHAGLASAPLSALPMLTKQTLMDSFDSVVTRPRLRLADVEDYLATLRGNELFQGRYFVSATAGTTGRRGVFLWNFREWVQVGASYNRAFDMPAKKQVTALRGSHPEPEPGGPAHGRNWQLLGHQRSARVLDLGHGAVDLIDPDVHHDSVGCLGSQGERPPLRGRLCASCHRPVLDRSPLRDVPAEHLLVESCGSVGIVDRDREMHHSAC